MVDYSTLKLKKIHICEAITERFDDGIRNGVYFECVDRPEYYGILVPAPKEIVDSYDHFLVTFYDVKPENLPKPVISYHFGKLLEYKKLHKFEKYEKESYVIQDINKTERNTVKVKVAIVNEKGEKCQYCGVRRNIKAETKTVEIEFMPILYSTHIHFYPLEYDIDHEYVIDLMYKLEDLMNVKIYRDKLNIKPLKEYEWCDCCYYSVLLPKGLKVRQLFSKYSDNYKIWRWQKKAEILKALYDYLKDQGYELVFDPKELGVYVTKDGKIVSGKNFNRQEPWGLFAQEVNTLYYLIYLY